MKLAKFLLANLSAFIVLLLIVFIVGLLFRNPNLINKNLPIALPKALVKGNVGQVIQAGNVTIKVEDLGRIPARTLPADIRLSSRAQLGFVDNYLWLELSLSNVGEGSNLDYEGDGQTVKFLLGARKPQPQVILSLLSRDVQTLFKTKTPLQSGTLAQGKSWRGVVAFPVSQGMAEFSLLLIPSEEAVSSQESSLPAFEIKLAD
jgi:hypothetical protein